MTQSHFPAKDRAPHQPHPDLEREARQYSWLQSTLFDDEPYRVTVRVEKHWEGLPDDWTTAGALDSLLARWKDEGLTDTQRLIIKYGTMLTDLVLRKNLRYGNSALEPISVFAQDLSPRQRMAVRMDDKVNRIVRGQGTFADDGENPIVDLAGYLLLLLVSDAMEPER